MVLIYLLAFCRITVLIVFALSFASKATKLRQFQRTIGNFAILPARWSKVAAFILLGAELCVVLFVTAGGPLLGPGLLLASLLLLLFSGSIVSLLARHIHTSCNCFGFTNEHVSSLELLRNAGFLACALAGLGILPALDGNFTCMNSLQWILVSLAAAVFALIWINVRQIVELISLR